jgi:excisionase family DNA binding protein
VLAQGGSIATYATNAPMPKIPVWQLVFVNARIFFVGSDDVPADAKSDATGAFGSGAGPRAERRKTGAAPLPKNSRCLACCWYENCRYFAVSSDCPHLQFREMHSPTINSCQLSIPSVKVLDINPRSRLVCYRSRATRIRGLGFVSNDRKIPDFGEQNPPNGNLLTVDEVAAILHVPKSWIYAHLNGLPAIRLGRYVRFKRSDIEEFLASKGSCQ